MMRLRLGIATLLLLSGCQGALPELKSRNPQATDYPGSLSAEYLAFSESEAELGHRQTAQHFAEKGLRALTGEAVLPEPASEAPNTALKQELGLARGELLALQTADIKANAPQKLARAQLLYDCWWHQAVRRLGTQAPCAEEFRATISELLLVADAFTYGDEVINDVAFAPASRSVSAEAREQLEALAAALASKPYYRLDLSVPDDGGKPALAQARQQAVQQALRALGIAASQLRLVPLSGGKAVRLSGDADVDAEDEADIVRITVRHFVAQEGQ